MAEIVFDDDGVLLPFFFDTTPEERHRASSVATENEVAEGVNITDHVRPERRVFSLEIIVSDTPIRAGSDVTGAVEPGRGFVPDGEMTRVRDKWARLIDARDRALLAVVTTKIETYRDMVLIEAATTRTAADASWLRAQLTFAEVRKVALERVDDPVPARVRDRRQVNRGAQTPEPAPRLRSVASRGMAAIVDYFGGA